MTARPALIRIAHLLYERGFVAALDGNVSMRLPSGDVLCTPSGCHKGFVTEDELLLVDRAGTLLQGTAKPTSELALHLACYRARPDVQAVIHAHPPHAVACTLAHISLRAPVLPEVVVGLGEVPVLPYARTGTLALAEQVEGAAWTHDAMLLERHGSVTLGRSLLEAFCHLEAVEHAARILLLASSIGPVTALPDAEADELRALGRSRRGV